jgi:hypothetical protein
VDFYNEKAMSELEKWKKDMRKKPSLVEKASKGMQNTINGILPEKYHEIITSAIKNMTKGVLLGSKYVASTPYRNISLREREELVAQKTKIYKTTAMIEGAGTGAGGILLGIADLPLLLSIKIKFLYDLAAVYGFDMEDYKERIYILNIFQLAFSSQRNVNKVFAQIENWDEYSSTLPTDIDAFDWRSFQQEYRDYIDLAKFFQLVPGIGAFVGAYVNNKFMDKLSETAVYAYRMRLLK